MAKECKTPLISQIYNFYHHYNLRDNSNQDITLELIEITDLLENLISNGNKILIHCKRGISRSATFVMGYLIRYENKKYEEAHDYLTNLKNDICPNFGFIEALQGIE